MTEFQHRHFNFFSKQMICLVLLGLAGAVELCCGKQVTDSWLSTMVHPFACSSTCCPQPHSSWDVPCQQASHWGAGVGKVGLNTSSQPARSFWTLQCKFKTLFADFAFSSPFKDGRPIGKSEALVLSPLYTLKVPHCMTSNPSSTWHLLSRGLKQKIHIHIFFSNHT